MPSVDVYLERGPKRTFACAVEWPGWARVAKTDDEALERLAAYGSRYAAVVKGLRPVFRAPRNADDLAVVQRVTGDAATDFGAPSITSKFDRCPLDAKELRPLARILERCWEAFDRVVEGAEGVELAKGPRGGGRDLAKIVGHVTGAEASYVRRIAGSPPTVDESDPDVAGAREAALAALDRAVHEGMPKAGPRGGKLWTPRYFIRRAAWHVLDHAWEIEDRAESG